MRIQHKTLIVVVGVLLVLNIMLLIEKKHKSDMPYDDQLFSVADTASLNEISIGNLTLKKKDKWYIEDQLADPSFVDHLVNVLMRVRVKKPIGQALEGTIVSVNGNEFIFSSNATKTKTFFLKMARHMKWKFLDLPIT